MFHECCEYFIPVNNGNWIILTLSAIMHLLIIYKLDIAYIKFLLTFSTFIIRKIGLINIFYQHLYLNSKTAKLTWQYLHLTCYMFSAIY